MTDTNPAAVKAAEDARYLHEATPLSGGWRCRCGILLPDSCAVVWHQAEVVAAAVVKTDRAFVRDAIHRDGADADAIRQALGLRVEHIPSFASVRDGRVHFPRGRRVVGEWQEVPPERAIAALREHLTQTAALGGHIVVDAAGYEQAQAAVAAMESTHALRYKAHAVITCPKCGSTLAVGDQPGTHYTLIHEEDGSHTYEASGGKRDGVGNRGEGKP